MRGSEGQTLAAVDALDESGQPQTSAVKPAMRLNRRVMKAYLYRKVWNGCGPTAMKEPRCATCRVGSINCAGNGWYPFKDSLTCCWISSTVSQHLPHQSTLRSGGSHQRQTSNQNPTYYKRDRGHKNLSYLLLKAQRMAVTQTELIVLQKTV
jgi:hypothetical protein